MKTKNVLHLVEFLYLGGIEHFLNQLAINTGDKVKLFFFTYDTETLGGIGKQLKDRGFPVFTYKKTSFRDWDLILELMAVIKDNDIDVIHTHDFGPMEYAVLLKVRFPFVKLIHTQHTIVDFVRSWQYILFFQFATFFYDRIISSSVNVKNTLLDQCPLMNRFALVVIPNGVDTNFFQPSTTIYSKSTLNLVSIARVSPEKNLKYLLNTFRFLKQEDIPFVFHHAGGSKKPQDVDLLKDYVKSIKIDEDVFFHGLIMDAKVVLDLGDIFLTSSKSEAHPIALLEAMSCGKLCFCSNIPAHQEIGSDAVYLFDLEDEKALFYQLSNYYKTTPDVSNKRSLARKTVIEKFSIERMVSDYIEQY